MNWLQEIKKVKDALSTRVDYSMASVGGGDERLPSYPIWYFATPFGVPRGVNFSVLRQFRQSVWVQMIHNSIRRNINQTDWDVVPEDEEEDQAKYKVEIELVKDFYNQPNRDSDSCLESITMPIVTDVLEADAGVWYLNMVGDQLYEIIPYDGTTFLKRIDRHGFLTSWYQFSMAAPMATPIEYDTRFIVYFQLDIKSYTPYGTSPLMTVQQVVEMMDQSIRHNKDAFKNGAVPSMAFGVKGMQKADLDRLEADYLSKFQGKSQRVLFHGGEANLQMLQTSNRDMEWLDGQKWYMNVVFGAHGLSPSECGFTDTTGSKNVQEGQLDASVKNSILPYLSMLESAHTRRIIPAILGETNLPKRLRTPIKFVYRPKNARQEELDHTRRIANVNAKIMTVNEARGEMGLDNIKHDSADNPFSAEDKANENKDPFVDKSYIFSQVLKKKDELEKNNRHVENPGSRGGHIIGYSSSGEPIYGSVKHHVSKTEAVEFSKDSVYKETLYHGSDKIKSESIKANGFNPNRFSNIGSWFFEEEEPAKRYTEGNKPLSAKINVQKLKVYESSKEYSDDYTKYKASSKSSVSEEVIGSGLKKDGYDGYKFKRLGKDWVVVVFDSANIKTFDDVEEKSLNVELLEKALPKDFIEDGWLNKDYDEFLTGLFESWEKSVVNNVGVINKGYGDFLKLMFESMASKDFYNAVKQIIKNTLRKGHDEAEKDLDMNIIPFDIRLDKTVDQYTTQQINGYTLPSGKKWSGIKGVSKDLQMDILSEIKKGMEESEGVDKLKERVQSVFKTAKDTDAYRIARTESARMQNTGKLNAYLDSGVDGYKEFVCFEDSRNNLPHEICRELNGQRVPLNDDFVAKDGRTFENAPVHPNCRCFIRFRRRAE